jgi:suppressor for copper-sensitivity B
MYLKLILLPLIIFLSATANTYAKTDKSSEWVITEMADFRLVSGVSNISASNSVRLGLEFKLKDGWKIYWRNAGDAGYPPEIQIKNSKNLSKIEWFWPTPKRFSFGEMESYGYEDKVVFPISATIKNLEQPLLLDVNVTALACKNICVPLDGKLFLKISVGTTKETQHTKLIQQYYDLTPTSLSWPGFRILSAIENQNNITINIKSENALIKPDVFIESKQGFRFGNPIVDIAPNQLTASLNLSVDKPKDQTLSNLPITLTFTDQGKFIELQRSLSNAISPTQTNSINSLNWLRLLFIALAGGVILNFMPCVLPVLTIKLLQITRAVGTQQNVIRKNFLYSACGVVTCFLLIATLAVIIKKLGISVGWGMHFQQPLFLSSICLILLAFAGSLFGWFHISIPKPLLWLESKSRNPNTPKTEPFNALNHFMTGAFATILASPCSAPFVGTALSFALSQGAFEIFSTFFTMGIGLALPYLLIAMWPGLVKFLPKPGTWMRKLELTLGIFLILTAVWLFSVLYQQLNLNSFLLTILLIVAAFISFRLSQIYNLKFFKAVSPSLAILSLCVVTFSDAPLTGSPYRKPFWETKTPTDQIKWRTFNPISIPEIIKNGNLVFVDITADWCLTCKINKNFTLSREKVKTLLSNKRVIKMQADWTSPDSSISNYLEAFNRYGIPFNVIYGPTAVKGVMLPELLSENNIFEAFKQATHGSSLSNIVTSLMPKVKAKE